MASSVLHGAGTEGKSPNLLYECLLLAWGDSGRVGCPNYKGDCLMEERELVQRDCLWMTGVVALCCWDPGAAELGHLWTARSRSAIYEVLG